MGVQMKEWIKRFFRVGNPGAAVSTVVKTVDYGSDDYMSAQTGTTQKYRVVGDLPSTVGEVPIVFACAMLIARSFSSVNFFTVRGDDLTGNKINHPILKLLEKPNPFMTKAAFMQQVSLNWEITGNAFIYVHRVDGVPVGLYPLMTKYMKAVAGKDKPVSGYVYSPVQKNGIKVDIPYTPDEILHISYPKMFDDIWGVAPLMSATDFIGLGESSVKYVKSFFANGSMPAGVLTQTNPSARGMDNATYKRLVRRWDAIHGGAAKAHKVAILEGGLDFKAINYNTKDIDLPNITKLTKEEIAMLFGVPLALISEVSNGGSHAALVTFRRLFWEDNIIPKVEQFVQLLNQRLMPDFRGKNVTLHIDTDSIEALRDSRKELCSTVALLFDRGLLTVNECRQALRYPSLQDGGDERYHNASLLPVGSGRNPGNAESGNNENIQSDEATGINYDAPQVNGGTE